MEYRTGYTVTQGKERNPLCLGSLQPFCLLPAIWGTLPVSRCPSHLLLLVSWAVATLQESWAFSSASFIGYSHCLLPQETFRLFSHLDSKGEQVDNSPLCSFMDQRFICLWSAKGKPITEWHPLGSLPTEQVSKEGTQTMALQFASQQACQIQWWNEASGTRAPKDSVLCDISANCTHGTSLSPAHTPLNQITLWRKRKNKRSHQCS